MKKIFLLTIALCMAAALAACGAETGEAAPQDREEDIADRLGGLGLN